MKAGPERFVGRCPTEHPAIGQGARTGESDGPAGATGQAGGGQGRWGETCVRGTNLVRQTGSSPDGRCRSISATAVVVSGQLRQPSSSATGGQVG
jgi:hypothetical protein